MFLAQHFNNVGSSSQSTQTMSSPQYLKLLAINLSDCFSWKVVHTHEIPVGFETVASTSMSSDCLTVTFRNGRSMLLSLCNPGRIHLKRPSFGGGSSSNDDGGDTDFRQYFVQNDKIFQISARKMMIKTVYEHFLDGDNSSSS